MKDPKNHLWYPYANHNPYPSYPNVVSGEGPYLILDNGQKLLDGMSSWWCAIHGYNHPRLNQALIEQSQKISHVMLGGLTHDPAKNLAEILVNITPEGLNHVFFSDSGSVGCEVALKMAFQYWLNRGETQRQKIIALTNAYHGDTLGVMALGTDDESMHRHFKPIMTDHFFVEPDNLEQLEEVLKAHHHEIAAMIVEPLMQGAGGFLLHSASYLNQAKTLLDRYNILMVFDEVATGFGRTGTYFAADQCDFCPDIMVLGKALTGGVVGHAATLATSTLFESFYDVPFMHGPTFMGNPLSCALSVESIAIFQDNNYLNTIQKMEKVFREAFEGIQHKRVKACRVKGAMICLEFNEENDLNQAQYLAMSEGVWLRPFSRFLYAMPSYILNDEDLDLLISAIKKTLS